MRYEEDVPMECPTCGGSGSFTIGDCEDGVDEPCPECEGLGVVDHYDDLKPEVNQYGEELN